MGTKCGRFEEERNQTCQVLMESQLLHPENVPAGMRPGGRKPDPLDKVGCPVLTPLVQIWAHTFIAQLFHGCPFPH